MMENDSLSSFFEQGFCVLKSSVPDALVDDALRTVNHKMDSSSFASDEERDKRVWTETSITNLYNRSDALLRGVQSLLGVRPPTLLHAQVALRFPGFLCLPGTFSPSPYWTSAWHIDGMDKPPAIGIFTLLVGVCLRDCASDFNGNLVVYPKGHFVTEHFFRQNGLADARKGKLPDLPLGKPHQVHLRRGDVALLHYSLPHSIAPNCGPEIRTMVYFRLSLVPSDDLSPMTNIFQHYAPLHDRPRPPFALSGEVRSPGYVDQRTQEFTAQKAADAAFEAHQWNEALPQFRALAADNPDDWFVHFKLGVCLTATSKDNLVEGEVVLRKVAAETEFANVFVVLGRNLQRQSAELGQTQKKAEALKWAEKGLLHASHAPDCAVDAMTLLADLSDPQLAEHVTQATQRYPSLAKQLKEAGVVNPNQALWVEGHQWLQSAHKDLKAGLRIFGALCGNDPLDYWAHVLYGGCFLWSGEPARALPIVRQARDIDPLFPHSYALEAKSLLAQQRRDEAFAVVERLLEVDSIKIGEPQHLDEIVNAVQVAADCRMNPPERYARVRELASVLFPSLADTIRSIKPNNA